MAAKYRPANGTEGIEFMAHWCDQCEHDRAFQEGVGDSCPIAAAVMVYEKHEPGYPAEWTYDAEGQPCCTAFKPEGEPERCANTVDMFGEGAR